MDDSSRTLKPWVTFASCVLIMVILYWAQAVLVPIALAILLTFVLTPPVTWLERWIGRWSPAASRPIRLCPRAYLDGLIETPQKAVDTLALIA